MKILSGLCCVVFACGLTVNAALLPSDFRCDGFQDTSGLTILGIARVTDNMLRLTPNGAGQSAVWHSKLQPVTEGFSTTFQFRISDAAFGGADGFAFVVQRASLFASGWGGAGIGYHTIRSSLAVEFDTWQNFDDADGYGGDPNDNHISVHSAGGSPNSANEAASLGSTGTGLAVNLSDSNVHTARIDYRPGELSIYLDDYVSPVLNVLVNIGSLLNLFDGTALVGFTASTGGSWEDHDILTWVVPRGTGAIRLLYVNTLPYSIAT